MDARTERTRTAIIDAMRTLLPERPWDRVSVAMICTRAGIARSTFYAHCEDRSDALAMAFEALHEHLANAAPGRGLSRHGTFAFLPALAGHMAGHLPLFRRNRASAGGAAIYRQFRSIVADVARDEAPGVDEGRLDFVIGGLFAVLEAWCESDCVEPADRIVERIDGYVASALRGPP